MKTRHLLLIIATAITFTSCHNYKEIGALNMTSRRNVDLVGNKYKLIKGYAGSDDKEIRHSKYESINEAIDAIMLETPSGEFLMNVKIFKVDRKYYAVSGDVWGIATGNEDAKAAFNFKGFHVGQKVQYPLKGKLWVATIIELTDDEQCTLKYEPTGEVFKYPYKKLLKIE